MSSRDGRIGRNAVRRRPCSTAAARTACRTPGSSVRGPDGQAPGIGSRGRRCDRGHAMESGEDLLGFRPIVRGRGLEADLERRPAVAEQARQPGDGPLPDQPAGGEDADPVAHGLDLGQEVAREQDGQAAVVHERAQEVEDLDHAERVDRGGRLVEDEDVGRLHERVRDAEALLHAARVRLDAVVGAVGQADLFEDLVHRRLAFLALEAVEASRVAQVLAAGEAAVEPDSVGKIADPSLDLTRVAGGVEPGDPGLAARRFRESQEHQDGRGLAGPVLPEQPEDLACPHLEVQLVDRGQGVVPLGQSPGADERPGPLLASHRRP